MKKIFKTISASLVTALIVFTAILTIVVLLEMFVVKLFPDLDLLIFRSCCVAIFNVLFVIIFGFGIIKLAASRLSRFLNKSDDNQNGDSAVEYVKKELRKLGFTVTNSKANFLCAKSDKIGGKELYLSLKERGILIRHFESKRIKDYNRITVGSREEMESFLKNVGEIIGGKV